MAFNTKNLLMTPTILLLSHIWDAAIDCMSRMEACAVDPRHKCIIITLNWMIANCVYAHWFKHNLNRIFIPYMIQLLPLFQKYAILASS